MWLTSSSSPHRAAVPTGSWNSGLRQALLQDSSGHREGTTWDRHQGKATLTQKQYQSIVAKDKTRKETTKEVPKILTGQLSIPVLRIHYIFQKYSNRNTSKNKEYHQNSYSKMK